MWCKGSSRLCELKYLLSTDLTDRVYSRLYRIAPTLNQLHLVLRGVRTATVRIILLSPAPRIGEYTQIGPPSQIKLNLSYCHAIIVGHPVQTGQVISGSSYIRYFQLWLILIVVYEQC